VTVPFETIKEKMIWRLSHELHPGLIYHNTAHTMDVLEQSIHIAEAEGLPEKELLLLKTAAVYHDSGFLFRYKQHEEKSCEIAKADLQDFFDEQDLNKICGMIMATKIPQSPHNLAGQIICDADLDYLGRSDFEPISNNLRKEFIQFGIIKEDSDWDQIQIGFFESHNYFTATSRARRNPVKLEHLDLLKARKRQPL
jgi:predicted metal-dependent HD superfamily phosphohydrolase